jgi:hypothetical protein
LKKDLELNLSDDILELVFGDLEVTNDIAEENPLVLSTM